MSQPDFAPLARSLRELVMSLVRDAPRGTLSRTAAGTLTVLDRFGPQRVTTLAEREAITQPAMTGLLQRMESAGLVERRDDPADGRAFLIGITDAGHQALQARRQQQDAALAAKLAQLSPEDLAALDAAVEALTHLSQISETDDLVH
jgi:DNA-binding MarR family transcriptional regulator